MSRSFVATCTVLSSFAVVATRQKPVELEHGVLVHEENSLARCGRCVKHGNSEWTLVQARVCLQAHGEVVRSPRGARRWASSSARATQGCRQDRRRPRTAQGNLLQLACELVWLTAGRGASDGRRWAPRHVVLLGDMFVFCATRTTTALSRPCQCLIWLNHGVARETPNQRHVQSSQKDSTEGQVQKHVFKVLSSACKLHSLRVRLFPRAPTSKVSWLLVFWRKRGCQPFGPLAPPWWLKAFSFSWELRRHHAHGKCTNFGQAQGFSEKPDTETDC